MEMSIVREGSLYNLKVSMTMRGKNVENCYECLQCNACCHVSSITFEDKRPKIM